MGKAPTQSIALKNPAQMHTENRVQVGQNALAALGMRLGQSIAGAGIAAAINYALKPSPLNVGEEVTWSQTNVNPSIDHIDQSRDGERSMVHIGRARDPYRARSVPLLGHLPDLDRVPGHDLPDLLRHPIALRLPRYNSHPWEYGEEAYQDAPPMALPGVRGGVRASDYSSRGAQEYQGATLPLPDIPHAPLAPVNLPLLGGQMLVVSVAKSGYGVIVRHHTKAVRSTAIYAPRYRDSKYGKELVALVNTIITRTYGTVSELSDMSQVLTHNMYGVENGVIKPAMLLEGGSQLAVYEGYLAGDYRLDAVGFTLDYGANQAADWATGMEGHGLGVIGRSLGDPLPYHASTLVLAHNRRGGHEDVLQKYGIQASERWLRAQDGKRRSRVSALFPGARSVGSPVRRTRT